jgi:hypothetical protein
MRNESCGGSATGCLKEEWLMYRIIGAVAIAFAVVSMPVAADAKGCIKGAIVGGAVGHYTSHHGLIGAAAGCLIGRHEAAKRERERDQPRGSDDRNAVQYH